MRTTRASQVFASCATSSTNTPSASPTTSERLFRPLATAAGLPVPLTKHVLGRFEVDFFWPDLGLVVETDGWRYHRTPSAQTRDALRFQIHVANGLTPLRFSHHQVKYQPRHVQDILTKTAANLRAATISPR